MEAGGRFSSTPGTLYGDAETIARVNRMEEALRAIAKGPVAPPPDPGAHSWQAWGRFFSAEVLRLMAVAKAALAG